MAKTNLGLVEYAQSKLSLPTIYMLSGIGRKLTHAMVDARIKKGCKHTIANEKTIRAGVGKYCYDCNALFKGYIWETSPGVIMYKAEHDLGTRSLYDRSKVKGPIATMPEVLGLIVWTADLGHVGIYVGQKNGINQYIEVTPAWNAWGFTTSADKNHPQGHNRKWAYWGEYHFVEYIKPKKADYHTVVKGENLTKIAAMYDMKWQDLHKLNDKLISDPNKIEIGAQLRLNDQVPEVVPYKEVIIEKIIEVDKPFKEVFERNGITVTVERK